MSRPWYPRYPKDYIADTSHLTMCEDGAYGRLLDQYYLTGEPLPAKPDRLYRSCRAMNRQERAAIDAVLSQFFTQRDAAFHNFRADHEISEANRISESRSEVGKLGAQARARARAIAKPIATAIAQPNGEATASTVHSSQIPSTSYSAGPIEIWQAVWDQGRAYLVAQGQSEAAARQALMRWRQVYHETDILRALKIAAANAVELPIPYIQNILNGKGRKNAGQHGNSTSGPLNRIARLAAEARAAENLRGGTGV